MEDKLNAPRKKEFSSMYTENFYCLKSKKNISRIIWVTTFMLSCIITHSQNITEENYLKLDSILWNEYEQKQEELSELWEKRPGKRDSIQQVFDEMYKNTSRINRELAMQYASVPSGLQRLYMVRLDMPKDTISKVFNSLSSEMKESYYGKNIQDHLKTKQIESGDIIYTFPCTQDNGEPFDWEITNNKQLLILYGGLGCMGKQGRDYLKQLYDTTSREDFLIIVYWPVGSLQNLKKLKEQYPSDYIFISDFKQEASPIKIKYGSQSTPTCFLTDKSHIVLTKFTGVKTELINKHLSNE